MNSLPARAGTGCSMKPTMPLAFEAERWKWENAAAGAAAGFATVAALHPLDVVRTRFQVSDGRASHLPNYKNTAHAMYTIARTEGIRGLYAGFYPAVLGSTISWGLYFFFYSRAKHRYLGGNDEQLSPRYHLLSAAEAGVLVSLFTNPIWLVKTRLQLQTPHHHYRSYTGFSDALKTILREEGWQGLYKGIGPSLLLLCFLMGGLQLSVVPTFVMLAGSSHPELILKMPDDVKVWLCTVTHGAIQFMVYEELRKLASYMKGKERRANGINGDTSLNSFDYAALGASSKFVAILFTYPYQVIRSRLQQRPNIDGIPKYLDSWHVVKETVRFEGLRGFYRGITSNLLKNLPASSVTFVVYENVLHMFKLAAGRS